MKNQVRRLISLVTAAVMTVLSVWALTGCSLLDLFIDDGDISFTRTSLTLRVGDVYDLDSIIESDAARYSVSSSDTSVVKIRSNNMLTAVGIGKTVVTAETSYYSATLAVTVTEREPDTFSVEAQGELTQTVGSASVVRFLPNATGTIANEEVTWYINDLYKGTLTSGEAFEFMPTAPGEYTVKAECGTLNDAHTVRAYYAVTATASYSGSLTQNTEPYEAVVFSVDAENMSLNPQNYIEWFEDGETVYAGLSTTFMYIPRPGRHTVTVNVNGVRRDTFDIFCIGSITPKAPTVEYDNLYPHVYLKYDVAGVPCVEITTPQGISAEYAPTDARYSSLFDDNGFDMGGIISLCADTTVRRSYRMRVKSLGDGVALNESDYSEYLTFTQLPNAAARYIEQQCLDIDHYVTSNVEYVQLLEYYVNYRAKTSNPRVSFSCYIAYELDGDETDLWNDAFHISVTSGLYTRINVSMTGNVMSTAFTVSTVNNPSRQTATTSSSNSYNRQLHAVLPHINYDTTKYRNQTYVFPIDRRERTTSVQYTDELYIAAQYNTRPVPRAGSTAETVYNMARDVLRKICTDDMTDMQKAHAIYDWIMWKVTYDTPATNVARNGEAYSAYYLEGVFGDGSTSIGGVVYYPYAVCDGMSKAYALMCNIEGIPCVRVIGSAGSSLSDAGGHAWNKVYVNDAWYTVDCTWGDSQGNLSIDGRLRTYELGLHDQLFLTDAQTAPTHFEPYMAGESTIEYAPKTSKVKYSVYADMTYNGVDINCYIKPGENERERLREIATAFARSYSRRDTITIPGGTNGGVYEIGYQGLDVSAPDLALSDSTINAVVTAAVKEVAPTASVIVSSFDGVILILMK